MRYPSSLALVLVVLAGVGGTPPGDDSVTGATLTIASNTWLNVTPTYQGAPDGGSLTPMSFNNMGIYDPVSQRTISWDRWSDPVRGTSIYANALVAYDPESNVATVLKLNNWVMIGTSMEQLPANAADPTPIDRHPLGGLAFDSRAGAVYLVNGANQTARDYFPTHPNDTWKFSLRSRSWFKVADASRAHPPADAGNYSGMIYHQPTGRLVYFVTQFPSGTRTWSLEPDANQWSAVAVDPTAAGVYISAAGITYDSRRDLVLAYGGGYYSTSPPSAKLWAYSVGQNKWTALPDAPIPATAPEFAYDSAHDIFLALVGQRTLIYNPRTNAWSQVAATLDREASLNRQNVTYNPARDVFVFQGGTWNKPVWSLYRHRDVASPGVVPSAPVNLRIVR